MFSELCGFHSESEWKFTSTQKDSDVVKRAWVRVRGSSCGPQTLSEEQTDMDNTLILSEERSKVSETEQFQLWTSDSPF